MDYTQLGNSGLSVSKYALGSIPFTGTNGFENAGGMSQDMTNHMIDYALDQGINQFDTANLYSLCLPVPPPDSKKMRIKKND